MRFIFSLRKAGTVLLVTLFFSLTPFSFPLFSQEVEVGESDETQELEADIEVKGKREANLTQKNRAATVTKMTESEIQDSGIARTEDVSKGVPNFSILESGVRTRTFLTMRGMRTAAMGEQSVGMIVDGVPLTDSLAYKSELFELDSLEVFRGSQGTYFGKNSQAGVINLTTKKPGNEWEGKLQADVGNYDKKEITAGVMGPVIPGVLGVAFAGKYYERDGYISNVLQYNIPDNKYYGVPITLKESHPDYRKDRSGRARLVWTPNENMEIDVGIGAENYDDGSLGIASVFRQESLRRSAMTSNCSLSPSTCNYSIINYLTKKDEPLRQVSWDEDGSFNASADNQSVNLKYRADDFLLTSITSRRSTTIDPLRMDSDLGITRIQIGVKTQETETYTQEVRLESTKSSSFEWLVGAYASSSVNQNETRYEYPVDPFTGFSKGKSVYSLDGPVSELHESELKDRTVALFTQETIHITDRLSLIPGVRIEYQYQKLKHDHYVENYDGYPFISEQQRDSLPYSLSEEDMNWAGKLFSEYAAFENHTFYGGFSRGYKAGGFSYGTDDSTKAYYKPETTDSVEAGVRSRLFEDRVLLSLSGFYSVTKDFQVIRAYNSFEMVNLNADHVTMKGLEAEVFVDLMESLTFSGSFGYTWAKFDSYYDSIIEKDYSSNYVHFVPQYDYNLVLQYKSMDGIFLRGELNGVGRIYYSPENAYKGDPYRLVNLKAGYEWFDMNMEFYFYIKNALDEEYFVSYIDGTTMGVPGDPRTYGVSMVYRF